MRRQVKRRAGAAAGALFLVLSMPLAAQQDAGEISGTVRDEAGAGLPEVAVSLKGQSLSEPRTAESDPAGRFRFSGVPPGSYDLSFRRDGYAPGERGGVRLAAGGRVITTATLKASKRYTLALTVDSGSASVITSEARVRTSTQEANPGDESAAEDTTITTRADLGVTLSDSVDPVIAGTALSYTVTVSNAGPSDARFVEVSDTLPAGVAFGSTSGCAEDPAGVATCTLGTIPAGGSKQYTITGTVSPAASGSLTNQASVASQTMEAKPGDESTSETTAVDARADLSVATSDSADPATAGQPLIYAVTVSNAGPSDAREVVVTGALPEGASFEATSGCAEDPGGVPTCTLGTIPANGSKQLTVAMAVGSGTVDGLAVRATVSSQTAEASPGDESATEETAVDARADLVLTGRDSVDPVVAGTALAYTVKVTNNGPSDARGVVVAETLPGGVTFVSTSGCGEDPGGERSCTLGTIPVGGSKQYTVALTVDSATTGVLTHRATVGSDTPEASPGDESISEETAVDTRADLVLTNRDSVDPVVAGLPLTYTVTVTNNGPSDARDVVVNGSLPAGVIFQSTSGCAEDDDPGGGVAACTLGTIPAGAARRYDIAVLVKPDATGVITNRANVSSSTTEDRPGNEVTPRRQAPPRESPPPAPPPDPGADASRELVEVARAWARAWSERRVDDYLAFYAAGFDPPGGAGRGDWEAARRQRVGGREWVEVTLSGLQAQLLGSDRGRVSFDQAYRSSIYEDDVRKTLVLVKEGGAWKILEERVD